MFTSKIRAAAAALGRSVSFARSLEAALAFLDRDQPSLVVLDLDNPRIDALALVVAMRARPALRSVPTLGFVSHVRTDVIEAARAAGVARVVARSAFAEQLPALLAGNGFSEA